MSVIRGYAMAFRAFMIVCGGLIVVTPIASAAAHEYKIGKLKIEHPWLRTPQEGESTAPLYLRLENNGDTPDKLIGAKSEKIGGATIHIDQKFITVPRGIVVPPHASVMLQPGGPFITLEGIKKMNPVGWGFELKLIFEKAGEVNIDAAVEAPDAKHAHDAEAMERWEKAHPSATEITPAGQKTQDSQHGMDHGAMDHGAMTPASAPAPSPQPTPAPQHN